jgi:hypothetical protein
MVSLQRATTNDQHHPCRCLCFWFEQITRTTPRRRTILHLSQIRFTDARTFMSISTQTAEDAEDAQDQS